MIIIDDCSKDETKKILLKIAKKNKKVKVLFLSKNYGQSYAMNLGLKFSKGNYIFFTDSDNEEKGNNLINFYKEIKSKKHDLVYGVRLIKKGFFYNNILKKVFIFSLNLVIKDVHFNQSWVRIFNKKYKKSIQTNRKIYYPIGEILNKKFSIKKKQVHYSYKGYSSYNFIRRTDYAFAIIVNYLSVHKSIFILSFLLILNLFCIKYSLIFLGIKKFFLLIMIFVLFTSKFFLIKNFIKKQEGIKSSEIKKINF